MDISARAGAWAEVKAIAANTLDRFPSDARALTYLNLSQARPAGVQNPDAADVYLNLSLSEYRAGRFVESIAAAREALKLRPQYAEAYNNIAAGLASLGHWDDAIAAARQALLLKPDFQLARNDLAWCERQKSKIALQTRPSTESAKMTR
jgi:tetratricopeptide (TPR) repeat protein